MGTSLHPNSVLTVTLPIWASSAEPDADNTKPNQERECVAEGTEGGQGGSLETPGAPSELQGVAGPGGIR